MGDGGVGETKMQTNRNREATRVPMQDTGEMNSREARREEHIHCRTRGEVLHRNGRWLDRPHSTDRWIASVRACGYRNMSNVNQGRDSSASSFVASRVQDSVVSYDTPQAATVVKVRAI